LLAADSWIGADLRALLRGELSIFLDIAAGGGPSVELTGPPVALAASAAQPFAMAIHELATNAVKYGGLSTSTGLVTISWSKTDGPVPALRLSWRESGGPLVTAPPDRRGFGSRVLEMTMRGQLRGTIALSWNAPGLTCEIEMPLATHAGSPIEDRLQDLN
jgi:two-component sensor histidine kinase